MSLAAPDASARDIAYGEIKAWILMGEIPLGMRLAEARIAARLQMSRTPVREALLRLSAERFVERDAGGGYRVNHLTAQAMHELYDVRMALELFALGRTVADPGDDVGRALSELRAEWQAVEPEGRDSDPDFVLLDEDFHERLAGASGNHELVEALRHACERIRPVRTHDFVRPGRIEVTIAEHVAILDAALAGDAAAVGLLERHVAESQRLAEAGVGHALERMLTTSEAQLGW
jgi:DNA-binding GntR family transcriptional regulator